MKFRRTEAFKRDFTRIKEQHKAEFRRVVYEKFSPACDGWAAAVGARRSYAWPASLRVDELKGTAGIMEMTWRFPSPDGRATFALVSKSGEWYCVWRRVGRPRRVRLPLARGIAPAPLRRRWPEVCSRPSPTTQRRPDTQQEPPAAEAAKPTDPPTSDDRDVGHAERQCAMPDALAWPRLDRERTDAPTAPREYH